MAVAVSQVVSRAYAEEDAAAKARGIEGVGADCETITKILNEWRSRGLSWVGAGRAARNRKLRHLCAE